MVRRKAVVIAAGVVVACLLVAVVVWALQGGGGKPGGGDKAGGPPAAGPATTSSSSGPPETATPGPGSVPDTRTSSKGGTGNGGGAAGGDAMAGFLNELGAIDPGLVNDPGKAMRAGQATCADLKASKPYDEVVRDAIPRFKTPTVAIDTAKATLIVDAARNHLCPG